jgi:hypothetical protein
VEIHHSSSPDSAMHEIRASGLQYKVNIDSGQLVQLDQLLSSTFLPLLWWVLRSDFSSVITSLGSTLSPSLSVVKAVSTVRGPVTKHLQSLGSE